MFLDFLIFLRQGGMKVSLNEWLSLLEGMRMGLHGQSVRGFFVLCRTLIVKSETTLDRFEELFYRFFKDVTSEELRKEMEALLHHPDLADAVFAEYMERAKVDSEAINRALEARFSAGGELVLSDGGAGGEGYGDAGRGGGLSMGDAGSAPGSGGRSSVHDPGDRRFRDWRTDCTIDSRQFQMAFRLLRELSRKLNTTEEELDIKGTIKSTCARGGILDIKMRPPRRNKLKLMVLIDSGGSMTPYEQLCSLLFQSLNKANTFTDLKIYYFHNYLEDQVYKDPSIDSEDTVKTEWILRNISGEYKVIFVGDAEMAMHELVNYSSWSSRNSSPDGITWFRMFREKYSHSIWLHPQEKEQNINWISESFIEIGKVFPMYQLSIDGLKEGMHRLMKAG